MILLLQYLCLYKIVPKLYTYYKKLKPSIYHGLIYVELISNILKNNWWAPLHHISNILINNPWDRDWDRQSCKMFEKLHWTTLSLKISTNNLCKKWSKHAKICQNLQKDPKILKKMRKIVQKIACKPKKWTQLQKICTRVNLFLHL